jgi:uncharacterized protein
MIPNKNAPEILAKEISVTQEWIEKAVIGLNLCPFAKAVYVKNQIRYMVSRAQDTTSLQHDLRHALNVLAAVQSEHIDTILLIHPHVLGDFFDYNHFLKIADTTIADAGLGGVIQIASFHPDYQFADAGVDDIDNYTNRSPYPMLHLLRETSIAHAVASFPDAADIYEKNIATLRQLGHDGWQRLGLNDSGFEQFASR